MALSMKERNGKKAWAAYEKDFEKLQAEVLKRREEISERHKNDPPMKGMGISPEFQELGEVSKWFSQELKNLRKKHGIK